MIMTVTLNPAIDKIYTVDNLTSYAVMRVRRITQTAGGKGINVSRGLARLGADVLAIGFVGGSSGVLFESMFTEPRITTDFTKTMAETRTCMTVWDNAAAKSTEFLEPGGPITKEELSRFMDQFHSGLSHCETVVLSGSVPPGVPDDIYARLIQSAKKAGKTVFLDTSGAALAAAIPACPDVVKPNRAEIRQLTGQPLRTQKDLVAAARQLCRQGIPLVVISLGKDGALVAGQTEIYRAFSPTVPAVNTVGCGDCMVAGFAVALSRGIGLKEATRQAMAAATANALTPEPGHFLLEAYERLLTEIRIEKL